MPKLVHYCSALLLLFVLKSRAQDYTFVNPIHFPYSPTGNPYVGTFVAVAIPIDINSPQGTDMFFSFNFESSYGLPENQTILSYPPIFNSGREIFYKLMEAKISTHGFLGKECLLRAICEAAEFTSVNTGVLGDVLHILLTPSSSITNEKLDEYLKSEEFAKKYGHCKKYKKKCPLSILNLFSVVKKYF